MRIIMGASSEDVSAHAVHVIREARKKDVRPRGLAVGLAKFIHNCDDCGQTYWDSDEWGYSHSNCPGEKKKVGF